MPAIVHSRFPAGNEPRFSPGAHRTVQVHVINLHGTGIAPDAHLMERKHETARSGIGKAREPQGQAGADEAGEWNHAACARGCFTLRDHCFAVEDCTLLPSEFQVVMALTPGPLRRACQCRARPAAEAKVHGSGSRWQQPIAVPYKCFTNQRNFQVDDKTFSSAA